MMLWGQVLDGSDYRFPFCHFYVGLNALERERISYKITFKLVY